jgi:hypothetical protein
MINIKTNMIGSKSVVDRMNPKNKISASEINIIKYPV